MVEKEKKKNILEEKQETLIRILGQDIAGSKNVYVGLTKIKGISWGISNAICLSLNIPRNTQISELGKERIAQIEKEVKELATPEFMKNRRSDLETGESGHLTGVNLDMKKEFDIKRMKQIKSYKGVRHTLRLPVRGQRTKSHFRKVGIAVGVKKAKSGKKG